MNWYYAKDGQQTGPIDDAELARLTAAGQIRGDTLVWREGMAQWQPYSVVAATNASTSSTPPIPSTTGPSTTQAGNPQFCSVCSKTVSSENSVQIGGKVICESCKPAYIQNMREGIPVGDTATGMRYAGFWIRFAAHFIDQLILSAVMLPLMLVFGLGVGFAAAGNVNNPQDMGAAIGLQVAMQLVQLVLSVAYSVFFVAKYGATPGKMLCRLRIVRADGSPVSAGLATGRFFAQILSAIICLVGYMMAGWDEQKRALHDRLCETRVIHRES